MPAPMAAPPSELPMASAMLSMTSYLLKASPLAELNCRYSKTFCWSSSVVLTSAIFSERSFQIVEDVHVVLLGQLLGDLLVDEPLHEGVHVAGGVVLQASQDLGVEHRDIVDPELEVPVGHQRDRHLVSRRGLDHPADAPLPVEHLQGDEDDLHLERGLLVPQRQVVQLGQPRDVAGRDQVPAGLQHPGQLPVPGEYRHGVLRDGDGCESPQVRVLARVDDVVGSLALPGHDVRFLCHSITPRSRRSLS